MLLSLKPRHRGPVDYYLDRNEPPGRWRGGGCSALGVGGEVRAEELQALLTACHPATGRRLGRGFGDRSARAFDATFSAPKSVSVLWALSRDAFVQAEVLAAHDAAATAALDWFERHGALTRRGTDGVHQVDTRGLAVAVFRQHTSRAADPQLHSHAIVAAKVQDATGRWLALDARFLKRQQRSIGWVYASALRAELTARLGVAWRPGTAPLDREAVVAEALARVAAEGATWLVADLAREIATLLPPGAAASAAELVALVDDLAAEATAIAWSCTRRRPGRCRAAGTAGR